MFSLQKIWPYLHVSVTLYKRDLQSQFREALLGFVWLFIPTLAIAGSFVLANQASFITTSNTSIPYPAYLIFSLVLWQLFSESLMAPIIGIDKAKKIAIRVTIPPGVFIASKLFEVYTNFALKILMVVATFFIYKIDVTAQILLFIPGCLLISLLGLTIGIFLAPFSLLYKDISQSLPFILNAWMFLTPVVYPVSENSTFQSISYFNPVTPLLVTTREFLTSSSSFTYIDRLYYVVPVLLICAVLAFKFFKFSWLTVVERIGN